MARKTVLVSDQSGEVVPDNKGATVRINFSDARRGSYQADLTDDEAQQVIRRINAKGVPRRGRRPKSAS